MSQSNPEHEVAIQALKWWASKRPTGWSVTEHLRACDVNTVTDREADLAMAVATMVGRDHWMRQKYEQEELPTPAEPEPKCFQCKDTGILNERESCPYCGWMKERKYKPVFPGEESSD